MPNTYKSIASNLTTTASTDVLTATTVSIIKSVYCANVSASSSGTVSLFVRKSGSISDVYIIKTALVPIQSALQIITEPIVLTNGDILKVQPNNANIIDVFTSYLEIT